MANDIYPLLLESLASGGSGLNGNAGKLQELLAQWNSPDQITNLLVQYLAKNQTEAAPSPEEEDFDLVPDSAERENGDLQEKKERARRLQETFRHMRAELLALRERNDLLAEALGACYLCWGEYPDCQECQGRGMPGSRPPNRGLFKQFVSPAMSRLQTRNRVRKNHPTGDNSGPANEMD